MGTPNSFCTILLVHSFPFQVLSVSLTIRDSEQRGVGLVELGEVKAEFGAMGDREEAQLCIKQVQREMGRCVCPRGPQALVLDASARFASCTVGKYCVADPGLH
eukprot:701821-Pelagomonas_calceolata.AAC.1